MVLTQESVSMVGGHPPGWSLSSRQPLSPHAGRTSLGLSFLVSQRLRGDRNHIALAEVWSHGVGTGRGGGKRLTPSSEGTLGKGAESVSRNPLD